MARLSSFSILGSVPSTCAASAGGAVLSERYLKPETIERVARHIAQFSFGA